MLRQGGDYLDLGCGVYISSLMLVVQLSLAVALSQAFTDWPPWAGDLPLNRYSPDQAVTLDPGNFVKEAMRAQLRKRLSCDKPTLCEVKLPQQLYVSSGPSSPRDEDYMDAAEMPVEYDELDCTALPTLELIGHNSTYTHGLPYNDCP